MSYEYYNENADKFFNDTVNIDMGEFYKVFFPLVKKGGKILDVGCGSGRDMKSFLANGFDVVGFDASDEMVKKARELTRGHVIKSQFSNITWEDEFDGVWASASLLHVPAEELPCILEKLWRALKREGAFFMSFKYGDKQYQKDGRHFQNFTEVTINPFLEGLKNLNIIKKWKTVDKRIDRSGELWLNLIAVKV